MKANILPIGKYLNRKELPLSIYTDCWRVVRGLWLVSSYQVDLRACFSALSKYGTSKNHKHQQRTIQSSIETSNHALMYKIYDRTFNETPTFQTSFIYLWNTFKNTQANNTNPNPQPWCFYPRTTQRRPRRFSLLELFVSAKQLLKQCWWTTRFGDAFS